MRLWPLCCLLPLVAGCAVANHRAGDLALSAEETGIAVANRGRVHVVVIDGYETLSGRGIDKLRERLNEAGFAKVSTGGLLWADRFEKEIRRQFANEPETRFVIVGRGLGVGRADALATKLQSEGIPVEGVVAIAPRVLPGMTLEPASTLPRMELASFDEGAAESILSLAADSAQSFAPEQPQRTASLPMLDDAAPLPFAKPQVRLAMPVRKPVQGTLTSTQLR